MNKKLIQMGENKGISIDENSNCKVVYILNMENALEDLKNELNDSEKELTIIKENNKFAKKCSIFNTAAMGLISYIILSMPLGVPVNRALIFTAITDALMYIMIKMVQIAACEGTGIGRRKKYKKLRFAMAELEGKIPELEKTLENVKKQTLYKESETLKPSTDNITALQKQMSNLATELFDEKSSSLIVDDYKYELPVCSYQDDSNKELVNKEDNAFTKKRRNN